MPFRESCNQIRDEPDFIANRIWFRPNATRPNVNKIRGTARQVPMWPQLRDILHEYLAGPHVPTGERLFDPVDWKKYLDRIAIDLEWPADRVRRRVFRVTYASARMQTLDGGAPVSDWTVQQEMGHGTLRMLQEIYVRIGTIRQRREQVEYRWEEWESTFLPHLRAVTHGAGSTGMPHRWVQVLEALPANGATTTQWQTSVDIPEATFYYIRDQLAKRGLVFRAGNRRGSRFYRAGDQRTNADQVADSGTTEGEQSNQLPAMAS